MRYWESVRYYGGAALAQSGASRERQLSDDQNETANRGSWPVPAELGARRGYH